MGPNGATAKLLSKPIALAAADSADVQASRALDQAVDGWTHQTGCTIAEFPGVEYSTVKPAGAADITTCTCGAGKCSALASSFGLLYLIHPTCSDRFQPWAGPSAGGYQT